MKIKLQFTLSKKLDSIHLQQRVIWTRNVLQILFAL